MENGEWRMENGEWSILITRAVTFVKLVGEANLGDFH